MVVGTLAVTETISWGILYYAFSVFLVPMQEELGWSPAALTGAYSLALLVSGLAAPCRSAAGSTGTARGPDDGGSVVRRAARPRLGRASTTCSPST